MKKKQYKRKFIGKIQAQDIWISEMEMKADFKFLQKLHSEKELEESIQFLETQGYINVRLTSEGVREFQINAANLQSALSKIPPEQRSNRAIKIHEDTAIICDYDNEATTLLSVAIDQTDRLIENKQIVPWIIKTAEQFTIETMGIIKNVPQAFAKLEQKNFLEVAENGPSHYRYRLNISVVQATINALPEKMVEDER